MHQSKELQSESLPFAVLLLLTRPGPQPALSRSTHSPKPYLASYTSSISHRSGRLSPLLSPVCLSWMCPKGSSRPCCWFCRCSSTRQDRLSYGLCNIASSDSRCPLCSEEAEDGWNGRLTTVVSRNASPPASPTSSTSSEGGLGLY